jgi:prepilin-type processing-associated H-X9-DG protein
MNINGKRNRRVSPALATALLVPAVIALAFAIYLHFERPNDSHRPSYFQCASNLHQIGLGIILYQNDHGGKYPDNFGELYAYGGGKPAAKVFICPGSTDTPATGATVAETARNLMVGGHCSYVYLGKGMTDKAPDSAVAAYDPPTDHDGRMVVLFADGHVDVLDEAATKALMAKLKSASTQPVTSPS